MHETNTKITNIKAYMVTALYNTLKSNRINTYEMLFEADEMMRQAEQTEAENERLAIAAAQENNDVEDAPDEEACSLLDNPEEMIKLLKKRRGL